MRFLPYENIIFKTSLPEEEVLRRLRHLTQRGKEFRISPSNKTTYRPYEGTIHGKEFEIRRDIHYRNSFLPTIKGSISSDLTGTLISIKMQLSAFVIVF